MEKTENGEKWYNFSPEECNLPGDIMNDLFKQVNKGDTITLTLADKGWVDVKSTPQKAEAKQETESKSNEGFVVNIKGKDFVTYKGLLNKATEKGFKDLIILEKFVNPEMTKAWCIVRLIVIDDKGIERHFDGFGSSTPENTKDMTKNNPIEMCHTRAKGRVFRDYLNIGEAMMEELKGE